MTEIRKENDHSCLVVEGQLSIFLSDFETLDTLFQSQISASIKSMMNRGSLNDCHPAIVNVTFIDIGPSETELVAVKPDDNEDEGNDPIVIDIAGNRRSWISAGTAISVFVFLIALTRYRYSASVREDEDLVHNNGGGDNVESDNSSSGAFVDISSYEMDQQVKDEKEDDEDMGSREDGSSCS